ncbi:MAG: DNA recombination protein RmuC [bacterium]|nr:DNA recombination protein RmuC [bacterium]
MELILILAALIVGFVVVLSVVGRQLRELRDHRANDQTAQMLNQNIQGMNQRLDETTKSLNERLDKAASYISTAMSSMTKTMGDVGKELGGVAEIGQNLKRFQEVLNAPKLRGNLGEHILADSLAQIFPREQYTVQYKFRGGETVDAVVKTEGGMIPIDSKFPLEQWRRAEQSEDPKEREQAMREFRRAVKKHIEDIRKKYILTEEGTVDFAVMYVPSEALFYDVVLASEELMDYARDRKVLLCSPNSFFHFLRSVFMGLERAQFAKQAVHVWERLKGLQQDLGKFGDALGLVDRHLTNAKNAMDGANTAYARISAKVEQVEALEPRADVEPPQLP